VGLKDTYFAALSPDLIAAVSKTISISCSSLIDIHYTMINLNKHRH
jgi:hypothetical protein